MSYSFDRGDAGWNSYRDASERVSVLGEFLSRNVMLPKGTDGKPEPEVLQLYSCAVKAALRAVRQIADESSEPPDS
jgi:hypothetical protein